MWYHLHGTAERKTSEEVRMRRTGIGFCLAVCVAAASIAACVSPSAAETYTLKAISAWSKTAVEYKALTIFLDTFDRIAKQRAPGELTIRYLGGPEVVKAVDQAEVTKRGMVDMLYTSGAYYTNVLPEIDALKLSAHTPAEERASGAWAYLNDLHQKRLGLYYLGRIGLNTKFHLYLAKKPIKTADLRGLNIRISPLYLQAIRGLGGNPISMPLSDVYTALERNVVDGYCMPSVGIRDYGVQKQTKYIVEPGFYTVPNPLLVNLNTWKKLPKKLQDVLTDAAKEAEIKVTAAFDQMAREERPLLLKEGLQVLTLPPSEAEKFLKIAYDEGWKDVIQKNPVTGPELKRLLSNSK